MPKRQILVTEYECIRCEHRWIPRAGQKPRVCPRCSSPYWDVERGQKRGPKRPTTPTSSEPRTLPTTAELAGSDPDYTGELSTAEYLAQARGIQP